MDTFKRAMGQDPDSLQKKKAAKQAADLDAANKEAAK